MFCIGFITLLEDSIRLDITYSYWEWFFEPGRYIENAIDWFIGNFSYSWFSGMFVKHIKSDEMLEIGLRFTLLGASWGGGDEW